MVLNKSSNNFNFIPKYLIFIFIVCLIFVGHQSIHRTSLLFRVDYNSSHIFSLFGPKSLDKKTPPSRTLVVYVYAKTHGLAEQNLAFFIRAAVRDSHDADYYFIIQQMDNISFDEKKLPLLPSNAHYIQHENKCYDIGTIGWFLSSGIIDRIKYKYFIFLNSSIRGPFIVSYYDNPIWYTIFTSRLNDYIKLVGSTINCEIAPHVQSYVMAMDVEGLNLLLKNGTIFVCYENKIDAIYKGEIVVSQIILNSGFGIDSLMKKYQNMDFRLDRNKNCNNMKNPVFTDVDGISLDPFEVVFVKTKDRLVQYQENRERVGVYEKWMH